MGKRFDSTVMKRCRHDRKEWDLCGCPWRYHVTHQKRKYRGKIPGAVTFADARSAYALIAARIRNRQSPFEALPPSGITVAQLGDEWLSLPRDRKPSAIGSYRD